MIIHCYKNITLSYSYNNNKDTSLSAEGVLAFLTANPDFFIHNEELLKQLNIPHNPGLNIESLMQRQVVLLREENRELKKSIKQNEELDKSFSHLRQHIYQFTLKLLEAESITDMYRLLCLSLGKWFSAHEVKIFLFNAEAETDHIGGIYFLSDQSKLRFMFSELFNFNKPLCDSLQTEHLDALFKKDTLKIKSTLLVPMKQTDWSGLFVLGSTDKDQYSYGEELNMLVFVSELVSFKLQQLMEQ